MCCIADALVKVRWGVIPKNLKKDVSLGACNYKVPFRWAFHLSAFPPSVDGEKRTPMYFYGQAVVYKYEVALCFKN